MVDKAKIQEIINQYFWINGKKKTTIQDDGTVDVSADVELIIPYDILPFKFGRVDGDFDCRGKGLKSLQGCPYWVGGQFDCRYNKLISLEGAPETVGKGFDCEGNQLETLQGAPRIIPGWFDCHDNPLKSLQGAPEEVGSNFILDYSPSLPLLRLLATKSKILFSRESRDNYPYAVRIEEILNQFAGQGKRGVPACMVALNNLQKETGTDISGNMKW